MDTTILELRKYGDKKTLPLRKWIPLTLDELKTLHTGERVNFVSRYYDVRSCKVNGKPKTWKRQPNHVEVPLKYGLYEYDHAIMNDGVNTGIVLVKEYQDAKTNSN